MSMALRTLALAAALERARREQVRHGPHGGGAFRGVQMHPHGGQQRRQAHQAARVPEHSDRP